MQPQSTPSVFWKRIDMSGGENACWNWSGARTGNGYGAITIDKKQYAVHRLAYKSAYGPLPEGKPMVLHSCDNPICCNPKHLRAGTHTENMRDKFARNRHPVRRKEQHHGAKLTSADVTKIRALAEGGIPHRLIAVKFGIGQGHISAIVARKYWK